MQITLSMEDWDKLQHWFFLLDAQDSLEAQLADNGCEESEARSIYLRIRKALFQAEEVEAIS